MTTIIAEATGKRTKVVKNVSESDIGRVSERLADQGYTRITVERPAVKVAKAGLITDELDPAYAEYEHIKRQHANRPEANY